MLGFENASPQTEERGGARRRGLGPALVGHCCVASAGDTGEVTACRRADGLPLPEAEGGACSVMRRSHLGIWVQLWNLNPKSRAAVGGQGHLKFRHLSKC